MEASNVRTLARPTPNRLALRVYLLLSSMALVRGQATIGARNQASSGSGTFVTSRAAVTDLVGDVPQDTRVQLEQQDQQLDDISDAMDDLLAMSRAMGGELDRQTKQRMFRAVLCFVLVFARVCSCLLVFAHINVLQWMTPTSRSKRPTRRRTRTPTASTA